MESQIYIRGPALSGSPVAEKCWHTHKYLPITVNIQLRSSINAGLTERCLYNRFCIERSPKIGFWGEGLRYLVGTSLGMQWPPIYVVWWKNRGDALNTLVCTRGKEITKKLKNGVSNPLNPLLPRGACGVLWTTQSLWITHNHTQSQFQPNQFRG